MKRQGEITVFLSLCLLSITALLCVMTESARTAGSRYYFQAAVNGALDNLYSRYHRKLWQKYRVLGLPYESEEEISRQLADCVEKYLQTENWYPIRLESMEVAEPVSLTDQSGDFLTREILDYMAFGVWDMLELPPSEGGQMLADMREAAGAGTMADAFDGQEREVRKLEQAVERIAACVGKQEELAEAIGEELSEDSPSGFRARAREFREEEGRMDGLIRSYERQAEKLRVKLKDSHDRLDKALPEFREDRPELFREQMEPYDSYADRDGDRRQEILEQGRTGQRNRELLEQVEELVDRLEEAYEESRDEENPDGEPLSLAPASGLWDGFRHSGWSLKAGEGDKEKQGFLDQVKHLVQGQLLALVLPDGQQVSDGVLPLADLPSHRAGKRISGGSDGGSSSGGSSNGGSSSGGSSSGGGSGGGSSSGRSSDTGGFGGAGSGTGSQRGAFNPAERALVHEYCGHFFLNAVSRREQPVQYEMEYLLRGGGSDRQNLEETASRLLLVRQGLNLIHILSDSRKREEARTLAVSIAGAVGIAPLVEITACFIMGVWAAAEAVSDLRVLFSGGKVPLWKSREDWELSLESLLQIGEERTFPESGDRQKGLSYESYLKLLLFFTGTGELQMRMLDLMEFNIRREEPGFSVESCAYQVDICGNGRGKHVFFALPLVENLVGQADGYPLKAPARRTY